jgi:hypothetical protein
MLEGVKISKKYPRRERRSMDVAMPDMVRVSKPSYLDTCIQKHFQLLSVEMDSDAFPAKFTGLGDVLLLPSSMVSES